LVALCDSSSCRIRYNEYFDEIRADRSLRRNGVYGRQSALPSSARGQADRNFLGHFGPLCRDRTGRHRLAAVSTSFAFLAYIKEEILLVLAVELIEVAIPTLMAKLEKLGSQSLWLDWWSRPDLPSTLTEQSLYMTMALYSWAGNYTHLTLTQQLTILAVAVLTSKAPAACKVHLSSRSWATTVCDSTIPVAGMALILDRPFPQYV